MNTHTLRTLPAPEERPFVLILITILLFSATALAGTFILSDAPPVDTGGGDVITGDVITGMGPGISVADAMATDLAGPLLVNGQLYVTETGTVYLTDTLAESFPPAIDVQRSLVVDGLDLQAIDIEWTAASNNVSWTDASVQLAGTVAGGVLTVSPTVSG